MFSGPFLMICALASLWAGDAGGKVDREWLALAHLAGDELAQQALSRHRVGASAPIGEEVTGAMPASIVKLHRMGIVLATE